MPAGMIFWMLMILWAISSVVYGAYPASGPYYRPVFGVWGLLMFVLLFLLGWKLFGFVVT